MKSVTAHMLEYTLEVHFDGNRSACARKLSIRRPDFNRIYDRCVNEGGSSLKVIDPAFVSDEDIIKMAESARLVEE